MPSVACCPPLVHGSQWCHWCMFPSRDAWCPEVPTAGWWYLLPRGALCLVMVGAKQVCPLLPGGVWCPVMHAAHCLVVCGVQWCTMVPGGDRCLVCPVVAGGSHCPVVPASDCCLLVSGVGLCLVETPGVQWWLVLSRDSR